MPQQHFVDPNNGDIYAFDLPGEEAFVPNQLVPLSNEELTAARAAQALASAPPVADQIAARRYDAEIAGITFGESKVDTGRDSQALITGAALAAVIDSAYVCRWKTAEGFIELNATALIGIASAIRAHVQACFDREADLLAKVGAGTYKHSMLDEGWPA